jgi:hypothetical protein
MDGDATNTGSGRGWRAAGVGVAMTVIGGLALAESHGYDYFLRVIGLVLTSSGLVGTIAGGVAIGMD